MANISSDVRNYFKLNLLLARFPAILRQLFINRYSLFNSGQIWDDTSTCGKNYLSNIIISIKTLTKVQRDSISNGDSKEWDISLLTIILLNDSRPKTLNQQQIQQLDYENKLLEPLKNTRNKIEHVASKSVDEVKFNQFWNDLKTILIAFGEIDTELDKLKDDSVFNPSSQSINEENIKEAQRLNLLGTQAHKDERYSDAIRFFTEATVLSDVSYHDRAVFYSNMSSSRLALYEQQLESSKHIEIDDQKNERYLALRDAKTARNLGLTWWKGHFRVGKAHASMNEHEKAINSFERALALDPTNNNIQKALDESRYTYAYQSQEQHLDPREGPRTMPETLKKTEQDVGLDPQRLRMNHSLFDIIYPSAGDVMRGYKYRDGDTDVKQDYKQAVKYFSKAANQDNAEGMYQLAMMADRGLGVEKDHQLALKLLKQAAEQSPKHPKFPDTPNFGVADAEQALAARYFHGITVPKHLPTAVYWYQRAVDHGNHEAANSLGLMYLDGIGIDKNIDKAEELFQLSADRGDPNAMFTLANLLVDKNDHHMAKVWLDRACEAGNINAQMDRDTFQKILQKKQKLLDGFPPNILQNYNDIKTIFNSLESGRCASTLSKEPNKYNYTILCDYANRGSVTAKIMSDALGHFLEAFSIFLENESLTEDQENTFVNELSQCYRIEHIVAYYPSMDIHERVVKIVDRVFHRCIKQFSNTNSQLDEDVRLCYVQLRIDSHKSNLEFLKQCKQKYPKSIAFYECSVTMNAFLQQYEDALYDANSGLEIEPNNVRLLYDKAGALRLIDKDMDEAIKAYQAFLAVAPKDHRKVPDTYYTIGLCYLRPDKYKDIEDIIKKTYKQGEDAEKLQLPWFLPYECNSKTLLKRLVDKSSELNMKTTPVVNHKSYLKNPHRIEVITKHREWESEFSEAKNNPKITAIPYTLIPYIKQPTTKSLVDLKSISIREMNPRKNHVYMGYLLSIKIIEEAYSWTPSIHLVVEDESHDCERMHIFGFPEDKGQYLTSEVYTIGSKWHIINPYLRIGARDKKPTIRIDDYSSIISQDESERVVNMCRCCGEANALHVCSKCKQARYCSRDCQTMDWQTYKHKLICKKK